MKTCRVCEFWLGGECYGMRRDNRINISCEGGHCAPDYIYTKEDFGCLGHSEYIGGKVHYIHQDCNHAMLRNTIQQLIKEGSRLLVCPKCEGYFFIDDLEIAVDYFSLTDSE